MPEPAPWKRRALERCNLGDIDGALAALIVDLYCFDIEAARRARGLLSYTVFRRQLSSPAEARAWILQFLEPKGGNGECPNSATPGGAAPAA